ncbi:MAG: SDR family oxidoreductase [Chloroflexi bacterium]|nr:SDR family oxidoreductase [Chloroflexota bacterium]
MSLPAFDLSGRAAIVTGAGGGFGREIALSLARVGCDVVAAGRREAPLARVAADVRELGRRVLVVPTDVTDSAQVNALVAETMAEWGRIDVLVNNAGSYTGIAGGSLPELTDEEERARLGERQVAGRVGRPQEVGPLVAFLASDAAAYLNGATISLDGGAAAGGLVPAGIDAGRAAPTGRGAP